jgi:RNA exonuclease 4
MSHGSKPKLRIRLYLQSLSQKKSTAPENHTPHLSRGYVKQAALRNSHLLNVFSNENCVALDCEMVGVGPANLSVLARVSIVDHHGEKLFDTFVKVEEKVTDYRTAFSGIRSPDLKSPKIMSYGESRMIVRNYVQGKVLVGHGLAKDLQILNLSHPYYMVRDTSLFIPFMRQGKDGYLRSRSLADLASDFLKETIQDGEHNPIEDAAAAMSLYQLVKHDWDQWALSGMNGIY